MVVRCFRVPGVLMGLNEYSRLSRSNRFAAANAKREQEMRICAAIRLQLRGWRTDRAVRVDFLWVECSRRRDRDNVAFAKKFVLDALVRCGTIRGDGWRDVVGFSDSFACVPGGGSVVVQLTEVDA